MGRALISFNDYSSEVSTVAVNVTTPADGAAYDAWLTAQQGLIDAIAGVSIGEERKRSLYVVDTATVSDKPSDPFAQRETKWMVRYIQLDGKRGSFEIPCADLSLLNTDGETMNISAGAGAALVTAIEGNVRGTDGELVNVDTIFHVGRNI